MLNTIPQYINTMSDTYGLTKTLGVIDVYTKPNGEPWFIVGNNSVIFRIRHEGRTKILKCYTLSKRNTRRIYGAKCLHKELYIYTDNMHGDWADVVLDDWIDGITLQKAINNSIGNEAAMRSLAERFDRLALALLKEDWAHGDLKPENIIISPDGRMHLIDFDALFCPEFAGESSEETGTAAFQHPARDAQYFNKSIDDYPIALISTALHALSLDPTLAERYDTNEMLLFHPKELVGGRCQALEEVERLFATRGELIPYHIALRLESKSPEIPDLQSLLEQAVILPDKACDPHPDTLQTDCEGDLWGYTRDGQFVIAPLYECCFDFSEGLAAVSIGGSWHYIDSAGRVVMCCSQYDDIYPFQDGVTIVVKEGVRKRINAKGEEI